MSTKPQNPLMKHFRQPAIYFKLPSQGQYWPEGSLDLTATGDIPVYPMTAKDEITLKTPDALLNGQGVIDVIQSCCPNIRDAWKMPSIDVDATLIAIRIASYGPKMDIDTKCPHCGEEHAYGVELGSILADIRCPNYDKRVEHNGLKIRLAPQAYFSVNQTDQIQFEEQQILRALSDDNVSDEQRVAVYSQHMQRLVDLNTQILVDSTHSIETADGVVVREKEFINEFYNNCESLVIADVQKRLKEITESIAIKPISANCSSCSKEYKISLTFDQASFFGKGF